MINTICTDKTGTLTENKMKVEIIYSNGKILKNLSICSKEIINNFCINSTADIKKNGKDKYMILGDPIEAAILFFYEKFKKYINDSNIKNLNYFNIRKKAKIKYKYPFSSEEKIMATAVNEDNKIVIYYKGSPEKILNNSIYINNKDKNVVDIKIEKEKILKKISKFQDKSKRVIAFSHKIIEGEIDYTNNKNKIFNNMIFDGFVVLDDPIKKGVFKALRDCINSGINIKMITGDNKKTANSIARRLKIINNKKDISLDGFKLEKIDEKKIIKNMERIKVIYRSTPYTKLKLINILKKMKKVVAFIGDGVNDVLALKNSDVGISMGKTGTDIARSVSDLILLNDSFSTIVYAINWGRGIHDNFKRFIQFQLTVNISSLIIILISIFLNSTSPFSALQLLWINIIMDGPLAIALGLEPIRNNLMNRKPINRNSNIITKKMIIKIFLNSTLILFLFFYQYFNNILKFNGDLNQEKTILFCIFILVNLFNSFNCRELENKSIFNNFYSNKIMIVIFFLTFFIQIIIVQYFGFLFNIVSIDFITWIKIIFYTFLIILIPEIYYLIYKAFKKYC